MGFPMGQGGLGSFFSQMNEIVFFPPIYSSSSLSTKIILS